VRGVASRLAVDGRCGAFTVEAENFESIHNHSAYARIARGW
jgi:GTP cyclohydrolase I